MNQIRNSGIKVLAAGLTLFVGSFAIQAQTDTAAKPDNSKVNKRDRAKSSETADNQKNNKADRTITQKIRQAVIADKALSTYAHNVKIITLNGAVTLKGPVRSEEEKSSVEAKAKEVAGSDKVTNQISVVPKKGKTTKSVS
ncbi:MAG: BON domain-containing protein [Acidobacteriota bacterium]|nr:BON domain-containing protein [Acidobacteriota bacterium]